MPSMYEIYEKHSYEYDELVSREDYKGNIPSFLHRETDFTGKTVIELGTGTGRLTKMYIDKVSKAYCFDRSCHMLDKAAFNLSEYSGRIEFAECNNLEIDSIDLSADIIIEGWILGHTVSDSDNKEKTVEKIVADCKSRMKPGGCIIFIESLGTNTESPAGPTESLRGFYELLESRYGFKKTVLETDYRFDSDEDAERITGFFFGDEFRRNLRPDGSGIVKEFTGAWSLHT